MLEFNSCNWLKLIIVYNVYCLFDMDQNFFTLVPIFLYVKYSYLLQQLVDTTVSSNLKVDMIIVDRKYIWPGFPCWNVK